MFPSATPNGGDNVTFSTHIHDSGAHICIIYISTQTNNITICIRHVGSNSRLFYSPIAWNCNLNIHCSEAIIYMSLDHNVTLVN